VSDSDEVHETAEMLRWGVSRLSSRLRAEQSGSGTGLSRLAISVLANLRQDGPLTPTALAAIEGLQPQSLTRVLNDLEEQGRIVRARSRRDGRSQDVDITRAGHEALREHVADGNAWLAAALRGTLTPAERAVVRVAAGLLQQLARAEVESGRSGSVDVQAADGGRGAAPPL
jgi:DNA-binding MarR family transcriptional regulator